MYFEVHILSYLSLESLLSAITYVELETSTTAQLSCTSVVSYSFGILPLVTPSPMLATEKSNTYAITPSPGQLETSYDISKAPPKKVYTDYFLQQTLNLHGSYDI